MPDFPDNLTHKQFLATALTVGVSALAGAAFVSLLFPFVGLVTIGLVGLFGSVYLTMLALLPVYNRFARPQVDAHYAQLKADREAKKYTDDAMPYMAMAAVFPGIFIALSVLGNNGLLFHGMYTMAALGLMVPVLSLLLFCLCLRAKDTFLFVRNVFTRLLGGE